MKVEWSEAHKIEILNFEFQNFWDKKFKFLIRNWISWCPSISLLIFDRNNYLPIWVTGDLWRFWTNLVPIWIVWPWLDVLCNFESALFAGAGWTRYQLSPQSRPSCPQLQAVGCKPHLAEAQILQSALSLVLNDTKVIVSD